MNYAILRTHKLHTLQQIIQTGQHNTRHRHTDHTDPNRKHLNRVLLGSEDIAADLMSFYKSRGIETFRKNGVLAVEMVLAFSPSWIKTTNNEYLPDANIKVKNWVKTCLSWAKQRFGDNLLSCTYHGDESSPHMHLVLGVSYWDEKRSRFRLSADRFFGSKAKLSQLQTDHAKAVEPLGLCRGVEGSTAKHQTLKSFYRQLNKAEQISLKHDLPLPGKTPESFSTWERHIEEMAAEHQAEIEEREELYKAEIAYWKSLYANAIGRPVQSLGHRVTNR